VTIALPSGPFGCILADPPWAFKTYSRPKGAVPQRRNDSGAEDHYSVTSTDDLCRIPVGDVAAKDCALFMWVVDSHLPDAFQLAEAWGFEFKTRAFTWIKSAGPQFDPVPGMGYWTRKQSEMCWLFTRGAPKRLSMGVAELIYSKRGAHSAKPDRQYEAIEALVSGPRLELFARSARPGWSAWGNEVGKRDGRLFGAAA